MSGWELKEPFDIDDGQLEGQTLPQAFVLGYECALVAAQLLVGVGFSRPIHPANSERVKRMCIRRNRCFEVTDNGPDWKWLKVEEASNVE